MRLNKSNEDITYRRSVSVESPCIRVYMHNVHVWPRIVFIQCTNGIQGLVRVGTSAWCTVWCMRMRIRIMGKLVRELVWELVRYAHRRVRVERYEHRETQRERLREREQGREMECVCVCVRERERERERGDEGNTSRTHPQLSRGHSTVT